MSPNKLQNLMPFRGLWAPRGRPFGLGRYSPTCPSLTAAQRAPQWPLNAVHKSALAALAAFALASLSSEALAAHCPHGQILRVSMHRCVGIHSSLAREYVHARRVHLMPYHYHWHHHHLRRVKHLEEDVMHGDPIEDRVVDEPPQEPEPVLPPITDTFKRSILRLAPVRHWGL